MRCEVIDCLRRKGRFGQVCSRSTGSRVRNASSRRRAIDGNAAIRPDCASEPVPSQETARPCLARRSSYSARPRRRAEPSANAGRNRSQQLLRMSILASSSAAQLGRSTPLCACLRSVTSRVTLANPVTAPLLSRMAVITMLAQKREPSLRTRQPSSSTRSLCRGLAQQLGGPAALHDPLA